MGIKIVIDGEGHVIFRRKRIVNFRSKSKLIFLRNVVDQMEIRVESVFRPNDPDVEICYALSGGSVVDMLHKLASNAVVKLSSPFEIYTVTESKVKMILEERGEIPKIIVDVHTHPNGVAELSDEDVEAISRVYEVYKEKLPNTEIYFGVHAVSGEKIGKRVEPVAEGNRIRWRSITREHEVAFYDGKCRPVGVELCRE